MKSLLKKSVLFFVVFFCNDTQFYCGSGLSSCLSGNFKKNDIFSPKQKKDKKSYVEKLSSFVGTSSTVSHSIRKDPRLNLEDFPQEIKNHIIEFSGLNHIHVDRTPLQAALRKKRPSLLSVATLLACGANPNGIAAGILCSDGAQGIDPNCRPKRDNQFPLSLAICSYRNADCMNYEKIHRCNIIFSYLLRHGARPEMINDCGRSCVHRAVANCNTEVLAMILERLVVKDFKQKDHCDRNALTIAEGNLRDNDLDICHKQKRACIALAKRTTLSMVQAALKNQVSKKKKK